MASGPARADVLCHQSSNEAAPAGALREGLDAARAADILWTLNHPDVWHALVHDRGWTAEQWEEWFGSSARQQLLGD